MFAKEFETNAYEWKIGREKRLNLPELILIVGK